MNFLLKSAKALVGSLKFMSFHFGFLVTRLKSITLFYLSIIYNFVFCILFFFLVWMMLLSKEFFLSLNILGKVAKITRKQFNNKEVWGNANKS